jgi:hypothetical protein
MNTHISRIAFFAICSTFTTAFLFGCGKIDEDSWYNNPQKVDFIKSGETFSDVSRRLMGQKVDSLGIAISEERAAYESGQLWIHGDYREPGHPIYEIQQFCNSKQDLIDAGELFGGIDCKAGTVAMLEASIGDSNSGIKEACAPVEDDDQQRMEGYINPTKKIYWDLHDNKIHSLKVYKDKLWGAEYELVPCDIKARNAWKVKEAKRIEDENKWFVQDGWSGIKLDTCKENEGPSKMIQILQNLNQPIETMDEIKDANGNILETTLIVHYQNAAIKYYRGRARCENAIANEKAAKNDIVNKYK